MYMYRALLFLAFSFCFSFLCFLLWAFLNILCLPIDRWNYALCCWSAAVKRGLTSDIMAFWDSGFACTTKSIRKTLRKILFNNILWSIGLKLISYVMWPSSLPIYLVQMLCHGTSWPIYAWPRRILLPLPVFSSRFFSRYLVDSV